MIQQKYNNFLLKLFHIDVSCVIAGLIMLFPVILVIPNSFRLLGVALTNICLFIYLSFMNISLLLYIPLFAYYQIQKDKKVKVKSFEKMIKSQSRMRNYESNN